ncbi:hypothetical protein PSN01_05958 [Micromonospora saelicesensis]|nr:hypothetical protein PSN01_05958 [Micromonospora saelicesensis]
MDGCWPVVGVSSPARRCGSGSVPWPLADRGVNPSPPLTPFVPAAPVRSDQAGIDRYAPPLAGVPAPLRVAGSNGRPPRVTWLPDSLGRGPLPSAGSAPKTGAGPLDCGPPNCGAPAAGSAGGCCTRPESARGTSTEVGRVTSATVPRSLPGRSSTRTPCRDASRATTTRPIIRDTATSTCGGVASRSLRSCNCSALMPIPRSSTYSEERSPTRRASTMTCESGGENAVALSNSSATRCTRSLTACAATSMSRSMTPNSIRV